MGSRQKRSAAAGGLHQVSVVSVGISSFYPKMKKYLRGFGFSNFGMDVRADLPERQESTWVSFLCMYKNNVG